MTWQLTVFENLGAPVTLNGGDAKNQRRGTGADGAASRELELSSIWRVPGRVLHSVRQSPAIIVTPEQRITTSTKLQKTPKWGGYARIRLWKFRYRPEAK